MLLLGLTGFAYGQAAHKVSHAVISFQVKNMGFNTGGTFNLANAVINFSPANLPASNITATVEVNSINTDDELRDAHLKKDDFFDAAKYPSISIKSVSFTHKSGNNFTGLFSLSLKGKTQQVQLPFTYTATGNAATFKGSFKINRLDFGIGDSSLVLANEVTIFITVQTTL